MTAAHHSSRAYGRLARLAVFGCALAALVAALLVCVRASAQPGPFPPQLLGPVVAETTLRTPVAPVTASAAVTGEQTGERAGEGRSTDVRGTDVRGTDDGVAGPRASDGTVHLCSPFDDGTGHGSGCSGSTDNGAGATLPGPAPQPTPAVPPRLPPVVTYAEPGPAGPLPGSDLAPDLHLLQVLRT